jgi:DNA-binding NtrC family response regulator
MDETHILLLDCSDNICVVMRYMLENAGFLTSVSHSLREAEEFLSMNHTDIICACYPMEGIEYLPALARKFGALLIFYTADPDIPDSLMHASHTVLFKPFFLFSLVDTMQEARNYLSQKGLSHAAA